MEQYAVIAAGGASMRFRPYSLSMPKEILPIAGVPAIQYVVDECFSANVNKIIIVTRPGNKVIADYFIANPQHKDILANEFLRDDSAQIVIIPEDSSLPYGNAAPLLKAKNLIEDNDFFVLFADDIIIGRNPIDEMLACKKRHPLCYSVVGSQDVPLNEVHNYGNLETDGEEIIRLRQKPRHDIISTKVIVSRLLLNNDIFNYITPSSEHELDLGIALSKQLEASKKRVYTCELTGKWLSIDSPERYLRAQNIYYSMMNESSSSTNL